MITSHRAALIGIGTILSLGIVGSFILKNYDVSIQPKNPPAAGCTLDAKVCPYGSAVGRVPPSCEFAQCPVGSVSAPPPPPPDEGTGGGTAVVSSAPIMPGESPMSKILDLPLGSISVTSPFTVQSVVEHRTALNGKKITVTGIVVRNNLEEKPCPSNRMCPDMYMMPQITIADSAAINRNIMYDLYISFPEEARAHADQYPVGKKVSIAATVEGSIDGVRMSQ